MGDNVKDVEVQVGGVHWSSLIHQANFGVEFYQAGEA